MIFGKVAGSVVGVGTVALVASMVSLMSSAAVAEVSPSPSAVSVTVVIPGTSSPTPTPTPSPSPSHTGGGSGGGGSTGGGTSLPTEADGSPVVPGTPTHGLGGLKLDHKNIKPHELMTATGTGFAPGERVKLVLYSSYVVVGNYTADASGHFVAQFRIPTSLRPGLHTAEATGWDSRHAANKEFTVVSDVVVAAGIPFIWWLIIVVSVLLLSIFVTLLYFRRSIAFSFAGARPPVESTP